MQRAFHDPGVQLAGLLHVGEEIVPASARQLGRVELREGFVEHVQLDPHLRGDERTQRARVFPCGTDGADEGCRVAGVQHVPVQHRGGVGVGVLGDEGFVVGEKLDHRFPVLVAPAVARERLVDAKDAREVLRPLHVARQPGDAIRVAGEQRVTQGPRCPSSRRPATS